MFSLQAKCPGCNHSINSSALRCPHCKKTIPKKLTDIYRKGENLFWIVFFTGFCLCLIIPVIFYDFLGGRRSLLTAVAGILISFVAAYLVKWFTIRSVKGR